MKTVWVVLSSFLLVAGCNCLAGAAERVSPGQLSAEIDAAGPKAVLLKYYDTDVWSNSIEHGIRSAAPEWLRVAEKLHRGADGAGGEDLGLALYGALAVAPLRVLPVLLRVYGGTALELCNVSFEAEIPKQGVAAYLQSVRGGLKAAHTPGERKLAASCSRGLSKSLATAKSQGLL
jgi:hypothetical protein